jgi:hypothetical protein
MKINRVTKPLTTHPTFRNQLIGSLAHHPSPHPTFRHQLITTDMILTALTCAMAMITTVSGIFGMNLDSGLQDAPNVFNQVTISTCLGAIILFMAFIIFAWRRGLLSWS